MSCATCPKGSLEYSSANLLPIQFVSSMCSYVGLGHPGFRHCTLLSDLQEVSVGPFLQSLKVSQTVFSIP